jgi:hypothetical protein
MKYNALRVKTIANERFIILTMNREKQRELLEVAERLDERYLYSKYLSCILQDNILVKLPKEAMDYIKSGIHVEALSHKIIKALGFVDSIFTFTESQLELYRAALMEERNLIRAKINNQRELLIGRRLLDGYTRTGE